MQGDGLSFPVNPDAGGESAAQEWAGIVAPRGPLSEPITYGAASGSGSTSSGYAVSEERLRVSRGQSDNDMV